MGFDNSVFVGSMLRYHKFKKDRLHWLRGFEAAGLSDLENVYKMGLL